jgi:hypothetical protein
LFSLQFGSIRTKFRLALRKEDDPEDKKKCLVLGLIYYGIEELDLEVNVSIPTVESRPAPWVEELFCSKDKDRIKLSSANNIVVLPDIFPHSTLPKILKNLLSGGELVINCFLRIYSSETAKDSKSSDLKNDLTDLYEKSTLSDFAILCGGKTFPCHKSILASRSDVFTKMFENKTATENNKNEVELEDFQPETLEDFMKFLYSDEINVTRYISVDLLLLADKYNVPLLKKKCEIGLGSHIALDNAIDLITVSSRIQASILLQRTAKFIFQHLKELVDTTKWNEMVEANPKLMNEIFKFRE